MLDSSLALRALNVTETAAIAAYNLIGKGDEKAADQLAVNAMRKALGELDIDGTVVIGEGERDEAPMLYIGEKVGTGKGEKIDIALDPLEGTTILATANPNSLSVMAFAEQGGFLYAPDVYMDKIAIGFDFPEQIIDLDNSPKANLANIAKAKNCLVSDLLVIILNRPRHQELIAKVREAGSRVQLIGDGDIAAVIATCSNFGNADVYMGIGGAPEGVLAAAALKTIGGQMCGRLIFSKEEEKKRAVKMGISDLTKQYRLHDLAKSDVIFSATGVTDGSMLNGVKRRSSNILTHSLVMHSGEKSIKFIESWHTK